MEDIYKRPNHAQICYLIATYNDAWKEAEKQRERMNKAMKELVECAARFKVGEGVRDTESGKYYVVSEVKVSEYGLKDYNGEPWLSFEYKFKAFKKDGNLSLNNSYFYNIEKLESTGRFHDLNNNKK